jgi:phytoene dehydrogenase-like protein
MLNDFLMHQCKEGLALADIDVVVIGAGLGGLLVGCALLAKQGRKFWFSSRATLIGGCCSTFEKDVLPFRRWASDVLNRPAHRKCLREARHHVAKNRSVER